jgi:hypothetical protein
MGHPQIDNHTPFAFEPVFIADEEMRPIVVTLIKATYRFELNGVLSLADEQLEVKLGGEPWSDAPVSSYKYEPETAMCKLATDVVLIGHAHPPGNGATQMDVGIKVGPVQKVAKVFGDRFWVWTREGAVMSRPAPLTGVALTWENAFGGHDQSRSTNERTALEQRNPVGTGFGSPLAREGDRLRLPNVEDPNQLIDSYGGVVTPCGFGFTSPSWQPRAKFAGTYDAAWNETRKPLLPVDFDRRFFNAAAPGLIAPGYLRGNEDVVVLHSTRVPRLAFRLPGDAPPQCRIARRHRPDTHLQTNLDTVIVNTDEQLLLLFWRAFAFGGPHDVTAVEVTSN